MYLYIMDTCMYTTLPNVHPSTVTLYIMNTCMYTTLPNVHPSTVTAALYTYVNICRVCLHYTTDMDRLFNMHGSLSLLSLKFSNMCVFGYERRHHCSNLGIATSTYNNIIMIICSATYSKASPLTYLFPKEILTGDLAHVPTSL